MSTKTFNLIILPILSICCLSSCNNQQENNSNNNEDSTYFENGFVPDCCLPSYPSYIAYICQKEYEPDEQLSFTIYFGHPDYKEHYSDDEIEKVKNSKVTIDLYYNIVNNHYNDHAIIDEFGKEFHADDYLAYTKYATVDSSGAYIARKQIEKHKDYILTREYFKDDIGLMTLSLNVESFEYLNGSTEICYTKVDEKIKIINKSEYNKLAFAD
ncbi:MAG: hypothetical protein K5925_03945 [Bacilli bacterium]|nr:hypothetical protein [Bacilli bacterium]